MKTENQTEGQPQVATSALLSELFTASAELRFAIKAKTRSIETNSSWFRHTEIMRKVEIALKSDNDDV